MPKPNAPATTFALTPAPALKDSTPAPMSPFKPDQHAPLPAQNKPGLAMPPRPSGARYC